MKEIPRIYDVVQLQIAAAANTGRVGRPLVYEMAYYLFKSLPDQAIEDPTPIESKLETIEALHVHFLELEDYEKCQYLMEFKQRVTDGKAA
jgi:hypothetical protein